MNNYRSFKFKVNPKTNNYWLTKNLEEILAIFPHNQIVAWLYQTARFIVFDLLTTSKQLTLWQWLVRYLCELAEKYLDFGDDEVSFEKASIISNPYDLAYVDAHGMKPGWAELAELKYEALVQNRIPDPHQSPYRHPLYRVCVIARACATTLAQRGRECEEAA